MVGSWVAKIIQLLMCFDCLLSFPLQISLIWFRRYCNLHVVFYVFWDIRGILILQYQTYFYSIKQKSLIGIVGVQSLKCGGPKATRPARVRNGIERYEDPEHNVNSEWILLSSRKGVTRGQADKTQRKKKQAIPPDTVSTHPWPINSYLQSLLSLSFDSSFDGVRFLRPPHITVISTLSTDSTLFTPLPTTVDFTGLQSTTK